MSRLISLSLRPSIAGRHGRLLWGIVFVTLSFLGQTRRAEATCGDYLQHRSYAGFRNNAELADRSSAELPEPSQQTPAPCHGPGCRQSPPPAPATPSAPVEFLPQQLAATLSRHAQLAAPLQYWVTMTARVWANDGYPLGLLRPPAA